MKTILITSPLLLTTAFADEQPKAEDLVGKFYGGAHLLYMKTDSDRDIPKDPLSTVNHGSGFGGELGYRYSELAELRFSYSKINIDKKASFFDKVYVPAIDFLYFPNKQNFYWLGGASYLDIGQAKPALNLGAGYRHYLSERTALYFEGKGHYQFSGKYTDGDVRLGFVYFFGGDSKSSSPKKKHTSHAKAAPIAASAAVNDADRDGVIDSNDQCANTPLADKVDDNGCTIFSEEKSRMQLLVNFDHNAVIVKAQYLPEIEKMASFLQSYPKASLTIEGHTSKVGSAAYNKKISQQRADAIVEVLVNQFNIDSERLSAIGYGEERLLDLGNDLAADAINRRIEAKVEVTKQVATSRH